MKVPRDFQRSKVYKAESAAFRGLKSGPQPEVATVPQIENWISNEVHPQVRTIRGCETIADVVVLDGRGRRRGAANNRAIKVPRFARTKPYLLHELSHVAVARGWGLGAVPWHGVEFTTTFLRLTKAVLGDEAYAKLLSEYNQAGVQTYDSRHDPAT